ncbi:hypothetical protein DRP77_05320, partial [Candidatus Poribacteria bacterium]
MRRFLPLLIAIAITLPSCMPPRRGKVSHFRVSILNTLPVARMDVPIVIPIGDIRKVASDFTLNAFLVSDPDERRDLASQAEDMDGDGEMDTLVFTVNLEPEYHKEVLVRYDPKAPMSFTLGYTRRSFGGVFPELEGIAIESKRAAYRFLPYEAAFLPIPKSEETLSLGELMRKLGPGSELDLPTAEGGFGCGGFKLWRDGKLYGPEGSRVFTGMVSK